jgi:hypothetical protein
MESYSATKKNGILLFEGKWIELENLSEDSEGQKPYVFSHMWNIDPAQIQNMKNRSH